MKYCLLSISYLLLMLLCADQLHAQQKIEPKTQPTVAKPKRAVPMHRNKTAYLENFIFNQTPLKKALRQVSKHYLVKVKYINIPNVKVTGLLWKTDPLSEVIMDLNIMSGAKLTLKDGTIINQQ